MTSSAAPRSRPWLGSPAGAATAAILPTIACLLAAIVAEDGPAGFGLAAAAGALPYFAALVGLPSLFPIAVARSATLRLGATLLLTVVAVIAGVTAATSQDAQAGLAILLVAYVAIPLGTVLWLGQAVVARRAAPWVPGEPATASDRLAALAIDVVLVGAVLWWPLATLAGTGRPIEATVLGVLAATLYLGVLTACRGSTLGHGALRLAVVDARTGDRLSWPRALLRGLVVSVEVLAVPTLILALPAVAELGAAQGGPSLTDRLLHSRVAARPPRPGRTARPDRAGPTRPR
ncbi:MAG: RDD family protein [Acidimicrobiia bacterium]